MALNSIGNRCERATARPFSRKQWVLVAVHTVRPETFIVYAKLIFNSLRWSTVTLISMISLNLVGTR